MPADHLQVMIEETPPGGTLLVPEAIYVGTISIAEPVTLEGQGRPVIDGNFEGSVVTITAPDVTLRGLTLRRSATGPVDSPSGVLLERADRAVIDDVTIEQSYMGITVRLSEDVLIDGVSITGQGAIAGEEHVTDTDAGTAEHRQHASGDQAAQMRTEAQIRGDGIWLWNAPQATVRDTRIEYTRDGIYVSYGTGALLEGNEILHSRYAVHDMYTEDLTVRANLFEGNLSGLVLMYGGPCRRRQHDHRVRQPLDRVRRAGQGRRKRRGRAQRRRRQPGRAAYRRCGADRRRSDSGPREHDRDEPHRPAPDARGRHGRRGQRVRRELDPGHARWSRPDPGRLESRRPGQPLERLRGFDAEETAPATWRTSRAGA